MTEPTPAQLKELADIVESIPSEVIDIGDDVVEGNRRLELKEVKKYGDYTFKALILPGEIEILEVVGKCPACGEMFMGKIEPNSAKMPCTNEDCNHDLFMKDRKLYCQKQTNTES